MTLDNYCIFQSSNLHLATQLCCSTSGHFLCRVLDFFPHRLANLHLNDNKVEGPKLSSLATFTFWLMIGAGNQQETKDTGHIFTHHHPQTQLHQRIGERSREGDDNGGGNRQRRNQRLKLRRHAVWQRKTSDQREGELTKYVTAHRKCEFNTVLPTTSESELWLSSCSIIKDYDLRENLCPVTDQNLFEGFLEIWSSAAMTQPTTTNRRPGRSDSSWHHNTNTIVIHHRGKMRWRR